MPILEDHPKEIDKTHTPAEKNRRSAMRLHNKQYGFFGVGEPIEKVKCNRCDRDITGTPYSVIFGESICKPCYANR